MKVDYPIISADSHVTEAPNTYIDYIDPGYREVAPRVIETENDGDIFVIDGMKTKIRMGLVAATGDMPGPITKNRRYSELHRSGYDATYRVADQNRDGVSCEVIYPSVGMVLCDHPDWEYKKAAMDAYNRWMAEYCAVDPLRLLGAGQTPMRSPDEAISDLETIKELGLRGVMVPGLPKVEDYDSPVYDEFWAACVDLELVPAFHILTGANDSLYKLRGPRLNAFTAVIRANQDIIGMLVLSGVFDRHPNLKIVCVEADAGWVPHYLYRLDHGFKRHRSWLTADIDQLPSTYFREHIYLTFQDDYVAFECAHLMEWRRLCWANDFPHSDSTWPYSQKMLDEQTVKLTPEQQRAILCDNTAGLYGIDTTKLPVGGDDLAACSAE